MRSSQLAKIIIVPLLWKKTKKIVVMDFCCWIVDLLFNCAVWQLLCLQPQDPAVQSVHGCKYHWVLTCRLQNLPDPQSHERCRRPHPALTQPQRRWRSLQSCSAALWVRVRVLNPPLSASSESETQPSRP